MQLFWKELDHSITGLPHVLCMLEAQLADLTSHHTRSVLKHAP